MNKSALINIENELKKRHSYPYKWYRKQNDEWDGYTKFIYQISKWDNLVQKIALLAESQNLNKHHIFQYTSNRWYNFWSAKAVEQIFIEIEGINAAINPYDSEKDFHLFGIPFDHKTSVYPKQFGKSFQYAESHKAELIEWLYKNQSTQKRYHLKNRLFLVVYNTNGEHWKLKAEISMLKAIVEKYVANFRKEQLQSFYFIEKQQTLSDIIWFSK